MSTNLAIRPETRESCVLVIHPVDDRREALVEAVRAADQACDSCATVEEAVAHLDQGHVDLVICGGVEAVVAAQFGSWLAHGHAGVPLVVVVDDADGGSWSDLERAGAADVLVPPFDGEHLRKVLQRAMRSCCSGADGGQADDEGTARVRQDAALSTVFEQALENLYLVYQPVVRAHSNCIVGYEALMRTTTPRFAGAGPLLVVARRLGRVREVDARVRQLLREQFERSKEWRTIFVNLDLGELLAGELGTEADPLVRYATRIVIEFTHDFSLPVTSEVLRSVARMREVGYRISAGNINSTTSSLVRMRVLAPDIYKLGVSVVRRCDQSTIKQRYIGEVVEMAHGEGAMVVAQAIERPEEHRVAVELGCDLLQGFLLGVPHSMNI